MTKTRTESAGEKDAKTTNTAENNEQRGERRWEQRIRRREDKNNTAVNLEEQHERWRFCIYGSLAISIWEHTGTYMNEGIRGIKWFLDLDFVLIWILSDKHFNVIILNEIIYLFV
jgi:hypothetical protein